MILSLDERTILQLDWGSSTAMTQDNMNQKDKTRALVLQGEVAWLLVETGPDKGKEVSITKPLITIGRYTENDLCLPHDELISRFHGRILFCKDEGGYYYEDLNSTNGTKICNRWFKNEKAEIKHGDRILIGRETQLKFFTKKTGLKDWLLG